MVEYEVTVDPEDIPFVGNCSAVDPETDREAEEWVRRELASGNELAWCWVRVIARVGGFEGDASCGGISCRDREELERVFLPDLRADALAALRREVESYTTGRRERETVAAIRKRTREARAALAQLPPDAESRP